MRIFITGASGFLGFNLAQRLQKDGHQITAAVRTPSKWAHYLPSFRWQACDFSQDTTVESWTDRLADVDLVINAVGIIHQDTNPESPSQSFQRVQADAPKALFSAASKLGVRIIQISAMGADVGGVSTPFLKTKQEADHHLHTLNTDSVILYPSIVIGRGGTSTALFNRLAALPITPLIGDGTQKLNPIHIDDFCDTVAHIVAHWKPGKHSYHLSGSEVLSFAEFYTVLRDWLRLGKPRFLPLPLPLLYGAAHAAEWIGIKSLLSRDALDMLKSAKTPAPDYPSQPTPSLREALWRTPATRADTLQAIWSGLQPALFFTIVFLWLFTALTSIFWDRASGYELLATGGITGIFATLSIFAGAILDAALGIAICLPRWRTRAYQLQILLMLAYMALIALIAPEQWFHPFGPVTKNLPLIVATWLLLATEPRPKTPHMKGV
ncbi:Hypothetical protein HDN1F_26080 [gamma proteobacterium HdN1]|nr:Hypothetical protein HDN1F_26080 [gamma proteobacterium HdN1]